MKKFLSVLMVAIMLLVAVPFNAFATDIELKEDVVYIAGQEISLLSDSYWLNDNGTITTNGAGPLRYNVKVLGETVEVKDSGTKIVTPAKIYFKNLNINNYTTVSDKAVVAVFSKDFSGLDIVLEGKNKITMPDLDASGGINSVGVASSWYIQMSGKGSLEINMGSAETSVGIGASLIVGFVDGADVKITYSDSKSNSNIGVMANGVAVSKANLTVENGPSISKSYGIEANEFGVGEESKVEIKSGPCYGGEGTESIAIYALEKYYNEGGEVIATGNDAEISYGVSTENFSIYAFNSNKISGQTKAISSAKTDVPYYDPDRYVGEPVAKIKLGKSENGSDAESIKYEGDKEDLYNKISESKYVEINTVLDDEDKGYGILEKIAEFFAKIIAAFIKLFSFGK